MVSESLQRKDTSLTNPPDKLIAGKLSNNNTANKRIFSKRPPKINRVVLSPNHSEAPKIAWSDNNNNTLTTTPITNTTKHFATTELSLEEQRVLASLDRLNVHLRFKQPYLNPTYITTTTATSSNNNKMVQKPNKRY